MNQVFSEGGALVAALLVGLLSLVLGLRLGRAVGPRHGHPLGLPEGSIRGLLALMIVGCTEGMIFSGMTIPTEQWAAFGAIVWLYFKMREQQAGRQRAEGGGRTAQETPLGTSVASDADTIRTNREGAASFRLLLVTAAAGLVALLLLSGCLTVGGATDLAIKTAQSGTDALAQSLGISTDDVQKVRAEIAEKEARKAGLTLLPRDAERIPGSWLDDDNRELTNGVRFVEWIKLENRHAPRKLAAPVPVSSPVVPVEVPPAASNTPPDTAFPGQPGEQANPQPGGGGTALAWTVTETKTYRADAKVKNATGALAAVVAAATVSAEITISGAEGWQDAGGSVQVLGRVLAISNGPPVNVAPLSFSGFASSVESGRLKIASKLGADVAFTADADLTNGTFTGTAVPRDGTAAEAFFQSLELEGSAFLLASTLTTNTVTVPAVTAAAPVSVDAIDISKAQLFGTHARVNPTKAAVTRDLHSSDVEKGGGAVRLSFEALRWGTQSMKGKTVDGRVYLYWQEGEQVLGGHFDWHGQGQSVKTLDNVWGGYLEGRKPPSGARVWFCITDLECHERTQVVESKSRWP